MRAQAALRLVAITVGLLAGLGPAAPAAAQRPPIEISGATYSEFDDASGVWLMRGNPVVATRGAITVRAPLLRYDSRQQVVYATGGASYADAAVSVNAAQVTLWAQEERAVAEGDVSAVLRRDNGQQLTCARLEVWSNDRRAVATGAVRLAQRDGTLSGERLEYDDREGRAVVTGNPKATTSDGALTADRIESHFARQEIVADGNVTLTHGELDGRAPKAVLRQRDGVAVLSGGATVRQGRNETTAQTITVDLRRRRVEASGQAHIVVFTGR